MDGQSETPLPELTMETGAASENTSPTETRSLPFRMMVVLSADELAAAIHKACGMDEKKMSIPKFGLTTAQRVMNILPPLYYEPRNEK